MLLDNDQFLTSLASYLQDKSHPVTITMKAYDGHTKPVPRPENPKPRKRAVPTRSAEHADENLCLIRAKLKNKKISTVVYHKDLNRFQQAYTGLLKNQSTGLKKGGKTRTVSTSRPARKLM